MKTFTIELTAKEIETLQIALCAEHLNLENAVSHLMNHNKTGINTKIIEKKRNCMEECDRLFTKLYKAENQ